MTQFIRNHKTQPHSIQPQAAVSWQATKCHKSQTAPLEYIVSLHKNSQPTKVQHSQTPFFSLSLYWGLVQFESHNFLDTSRSYITTVCLNSTMIKIEALLCQTINFCMRHVDYSEEIKESCALSASTKSMCRTTWSVPLCHNALAAV